ncbi:hypothetical protein CKA32_002260 [Geitlerinema sp. FC II]|nr:hypothetical protein CKA32_002260 [Geitlerinema sp. FC II]
MTLESLEPSADSFLSDGMGTRTRGKRQARTEKAEVVSQTLPLVP